MESTTAVPIFSALAHPGRLAVVRMLVPRGDQGLAAGEIADRLSAPANTTSTNLAILEHCGLIASRREGRRIVYAVSGQTLGALIGFLVHDCCGGRPELCAPAMPVREDARC